MRRASTPCLVIGAKGRGARVLSTSTEPSPRRPSNYWASKENQIAFLTTLADNLGFKVGDYNAWYKVTSRDFARNRGLGLLSRHGSSVFRLLKRSFPEHSWDKDRFPHKPQNYWDSQDNRVKFLSRIGERLGIKPRQLEGWYGVTPKQLVDHGAIGLLRRYESVAVMLLSVFPEYNWDQERFSKEQLQKLTRKAPATKKADLLWLKVAHLPEGFFLDRNNRVQYVEWLAKKVGVEKQNLKKADFLSNRGGGLLNAYGNSIEGILASLMSTNNSELSDITVRARLESIGQAIGIPEGDLNSWYNITRTMLLKHGFPSALLSNYGNSPHALLKEAYPEHNWLPWRFSRVPALAAMDPKVMKEVLRMIEKECFVNREADWDSISKTQLQKLGVASMIEHVGGLRKAVGLYSHSDLK